MNLQVGDRVFATWPIETDKIRVFGGGVYEGRFIPSKNWAFKDNPRIKLDTGETIWGFECWWDREAIYKEALQNTEGEVLYTTYKEYQDYVKHLSKEAIHEPDSHDGRSGAPDPTE